MAADAPKTNIILTNRIQVIDFLQGKPDADAEIKWTCPRCGTQNVGAYHSHETPCGGCDQYRFIRLSLSRHGIRNGVMRSAQIEERRRWILERIEEAKSEIEGHENEIGDLEWEISRLQQELNGLHYAEEVPA